eukprot:m.189652 g.189652  ORF g.189652 m.189652 type:complete len:393 (+) comp10036_c0_seq8:247-1425(+)
MRCTRSSLSRVLSTHALAEHLKKRIGINRLQPAIAVGAFDAAAAPGCRISGKGYPLLTDPVGRNAVWALAARGTLKGVPVDLRRAAEESLDNAIRLWAGQRTERMPLLCNAASRGTGKTVLLAFNQSWFAQRGGFSVYITFNDDQCGGPFPYRSEGYDSIGGAIALRIIHRALAYHLGTHAATDFLRDEQKYILDRLRNTRLKIAFDVMKKLVGVPLDTPTLLVIDELAKWDCAFSGDGDASLVTREALSSIVAFCDFMKGTKQPVYPCVSLYGCMDLQTFAARSNRPLFLQMLSPVFPFTLPTDVAQLPAILRVFAEHRSLLDSAYRDDCTRQLLPLRDGKLLTFVPLPVLDRLPCTQDPKTPTPTLHVLLELCASLSKYNLSQHRPEGCQ